MGANVTDGAVAPSLTLKTCLPTAGRPVVPARQIPHRRALGIPRADKFIRLSFIQSAAVHGAPLVVLFAKIKTSTPQNGLHVLMCSARAFHVCPL